MIVVISYIHLPEDCAPYSQPSWDVEGNEVGNGVKWMAGDRPDPASYYVLQSAGCALCRVQCAESNALMRDAR